MTGPSGPAVRPVSGMCKGASQLSPLETLLRPRSLAIIGATDRPGAYGGRAAANITASSIGGRVYYVNPGRTELYGRPCYPSVSALPEKVDCVVLCVPAKAVCGCLEEAGQLGIKAAVVYASGFSESQTEEGRALEAQLVEVCRRYGMALNGPNTAGIINKVDNVSLTVGKVEFFTPSIPSGLGIVGQSGFIVGNLGQMLSSSIAYAVGSGNGCVTRLEDYLEFFVENDRINTIGIYLEGLRDVEKFQAALHAAALRRKPVIVLKSGKSARGAKAAASHTGNLAGSYAACESVLRKYGAISTGSLEEFVSTCRMFALAGDRRPAKPEAAIINFSGGENAICADLCQASGIIPAEYSEETRRRMRGILPPFAAAANPLDATTDLFSAPERLGELLLALADDPAVGHIIMGSEMNIVLEKKDETIRATIRALRESGRELPPVFLVPSFERDRNRAAIAELERLGVVFLSTGEIGYKALGNLARFTAFDPAAISAGSAVPAASAAGEKTAYSESRSKSEIAALGIRVPRQVSVPSAEHLAAALEGIPFPVVLKVDSPDILHKTEAGGVKLGINDISAANTAFEEIITSCRAHMPAARIDGVLVQEMVPAGVEMIVGVTRDPQFGQMLMVGLGGIFVEVFKDVAMAPCPVDRRGAEELLKQLKGYALLNRYRGAPPCDIDALADIMVKVSKYAQDNKETLAEMDLNPVFVYERGQGACVADALIVKYQ